jgi:hypothetical protein
MTSFTLPENWMLLEDGWAASTTTKADPNFEQALACARSDYQEGLIMGREAWSGSTLKGKAKKYGGKYATTRQALEARMKAANVVFSFQTLGKRRVLCIGDVGLPTTPPPVESEHGPINSVADLLAEMTP